MIFTEFMLSDSAQRDALPAGGRDETRLFCRDQLPATQPAKKRGDSHPSGARGVGCIYVLSHVNRLDTYFDEIGFSEPIFDDHWDAVFTLVSDLEHDISIMHIFIL